MTFKTILWLAGIIIFAACSKSTPQHEASDTVLKKEDSTTAVRQMSKVVTEPAPEIQRDPLLIPADDEEYIMKVLTTGTFHAGEVWDNVEKEIGSDYSVATMSVPCQKQNLLPKE